MNLGITLCTLLLLAIGAPGATIVLPASMDNTLYENPGGSLSNGAGDYFFAGRSNHPPGTTDNPSIERGLIRRGLVAFDIHGSLPARAIISTAVLQVFASNVSTNIDPVADTAGLTIHRLTMDWGEGVSDASGQEGAGANAQIGDATWIHNAYTMSTWNTAGGDYLVNPTAQTTVAGIGVYSFQSTQLSQDIQGWLDSPGSNFGWILVGDESTHLTARRFNSRTHPLDATRPSLTITYIIPEASVSTYLILGYCLLGMRKRHQI